MPYEQDIWLHPIILTAANNKFRLLENVGVSDDERIVTLAVGTYYAHADSALDATHQGLYRAISLALLALPATNTYTFGTIDPVQSSAFLLSGLRLTALAATVDFEIDFDDPDFTMRPEWFGFRAATATQDYGQLTFAGGNILGSTTGGGGEFIDSDFTVLGRWYTHTLDGSHAASDKRSDEERNTKYSHKRIQDAEAVRWNSDRTRVMFYEWVKSPHVRNNRADDGDISWLIATDLAQFDTLNAWEDVWNELSDLGEVLIMHNRLTPNVLVVDGDHEAVRFSSDAQAGKLSDTFTLHQEDGEWYMIRVMLWISPALNNYPH